MGLELEIFLINLFSLKHDDTETQSFSPKDDKDVVEELEHTELRLMNILKIKY